MERTLSKKSQNPEDNIRFGRGSKKTGPDVFMRKGQVGVWKNHFDEEAKAIFNEKESNALIRLQYEKKLFW